MHERKLIVQTWLPKWSGDGGVDNVENVGLVGLVRSLRYDCVEGFCMFCDLRFSSALETEDGPK
jgi:hypothetical protein